MLHILIFLVSLSARAIRAVCRRRADLVIENLALRQQVALLKKERPRPPLDDMDRAFWVALRQSWPVWASSCHRQSRHRSSVASGTIPEILGKNFSAPPTGAASS